MICRKTAPADVIMFLDEIPAVLCSSMSSAIAAMRRTKATTFDSIQETRQPERNASARTKNSWRFEQSWVGFRSANPISLILLR